MTRRTRRNTQNLSSALAILLLLVTGVLTKATQQSTSEPAPHPCEPTVVGDLEISTFHSKVFNDQQTLRIWLPPGYRELINRASKYPVLYLLDGQNLFDRCTAFDHQHEWRVDETMTELIAQKKIVPVIVVGIDSAGATRAREYLPYKDFTFRAKMREPEGKRFPEFLATEVLPYVTAHYRIDPASATTAIGGSSYGAVAALYALLTRPDLFGMGLLESTSLQVGNGQLLRDTIPLPKGPTRVYLGVGTDEADSEAHRVGGPDINTGFVAMTQQLAANFAAALFNKPAVLTFIQQDGTHSEKCWAERFPRAVEFLYGLHGVDDLPVRKR